MIKTILFDVDGTIIDTEYVMTHSLQKTLLEDLKKEVSIRDLDYILGIPGREAIKRFTNNEQEIDKILLRWGENVLLLANHAQVFSGIEKTLQNLKLKGIQLGIVTSKTRQEMKNEFEGFNLNQYFDIFVTASDTDLHKPSPVPIQMAIDKLNIKKDETIYIGDSLYDMKSAKACGIAFGLAKWGAKNINLFHDVDVFLESPIDIYNFIENQKS